MLTIRIIHNRISLSSFYANVVVNMMVDMSNDSGKPKSKLRIKPRGRVSGFRRAGGVRCPRIAGVERPAPFLHVKIIYSLRAANQEYTSVQSPIIPSLPHYTVSSLVGYHIACDSLRRDNVKRLRCA